MHYRITLCLYIAILGAPSASMACDAHATHVALTGNDANDRLIASAHHQFSQYDRPSHGGHEFTSHQTQIAAGLWLTDRWAVQLAAPHLYRKLDDESESGIGDATGIVLYRAMDRAGGRLPVRLDLYAGVKAPTGDSDRLKEEKTAGGHGAHADHHAHGHHLATGSGSWDSLFGASGSIRHERWLGRADAQFALRTEGDHDFQYGDEFNWNVGAHYVVASKGDTSVSAGVEWTGERRGNNRQDGVTQHGSDRTAGYIGPAVRVASGTRIQLVAALDFPVSGKNDGLHGAADYRARAGAAWSF